MGLGTILERPATEGLAPPKVPGVVATALLLVALGCGGDSDAPSGPSPCVDALSPAQAVDCGASGACLPIEVAGDEPAATPGAFKGYADPAIARDPAAPGRLWLAYSWPHVLAGRAPDGRSVLMAAVSTHLARSDDGGMSFRYVGEPWSAVRLTDPEGSGENGVVSSETASLAAMESGGTVTWYGAHLRYFLRPQTGYNPNYATSWHVRVGAAPSPPELATAEEAVLGVSATAPAYRPDVRLDVLSGLPLTRCAMLNNPGLFAADGTLFLVVECLAFVGTSLDFANTTTQVFATTPAGPPPAWAWRHVGMLADHRLASELGADTIQQPELSLAEDGTPLIVLTPADEDATTVVGTTGRGCVALELHSLDPPRLRRDCDGRAVTRASIAGLGIGACTFDSESLTGIVATSKVGDGSWTIHASGLRP